MPTPGLLTREDCSRRKSRAEDILERTNRADCDHLYQRVTQCARGVSGDQACLVNEGRDT